MIINGLELILFQNLENKDKEDILTWRNDENVRKWMYHSEAIDLASHYQFIDSLKLSKTKKYFLVLQNKKKIGIIYFTNITGKSSEFGLYSNPILKGAGKVLLDTICIYAFNHLRIERLIAEVFDFNYRAIALYRKKGFKQFETKTVNEKKVICMELIK